MLNLHLSIDAPNYSEMEVALNEVRRLVGLGYRSGSDGNDDSDFTFYITGSIEDDPQYEAELREYLKNHPEYDALELDLQEKYGVGSVEELVFEQLEELAILYGFQEG